MHSFRNEFFTCLFKIQNVQVIQNDVIKCCKMMSSNVALLHSNNCCVLEPANCEDLDLHVVIFFYSVINPVFQTFTDLELCSQRLTTNCSGIFQGFTIRGNDSVQEFKRNLSDSVMDVHKHLIEKGNCSSYEDQATMDNSTFFQVMKSSNTIIGILAILISTLPRTGITLVFSGPLRNENIFAVVFWFGFITTSASLTLLWTLENPKIPSSKTDILLISIHAVTLAILFTKNTAMKYVSPVICEVMASFSVPLMLIVEHFMFTFCFEGKELEMIGSSIIFLVSFSVPLLEYQSNLGGPNLI